MVEVALESLLRQWDELAGWLREERQNLITADDVERNAAAWATHDRDPAWLVTGTRLTDAETLADTPEFRDRLAHTREYLAACRHAENQKLTSRRRTAPSRTPPRPGAPADRRSPRRRPAPTLAASGDRRRS